MAARQALGKGLGALIPEVKRDYQTCGIEEVHPNPLQPRKSFDSGQLQELVNSIREKGILQPLVVRRKGNGYELIAGERRWRAAQKAGVKEVPILIREVAEGELLELSLIENIQREDLNPIEEADAFRGLMEQFHLTQEEISRRVGKDRSTVANAVRLLKLPPEIRQGLAEGQVSMGHARAFLSLEGPEKQKSAYKKVLSAGLSVRQTENLVRRMHSAEQNRPTKREGKWQPLGEELQRTLGTKVRIFGRGKRGRIEIEFYSLEELDRLIELLRETGTKRV